MHEPTDPFEHPKLLLETAREDIENIKTRSKAFFDQQPYVRVVESNPKTGDEVHKVKLTAKVPGRLTTTTFHVLNGLRAALDQTVHAACATLGITKLKVVYFPF